jgi:sigma-B regulation protein RsbU (phosphoserine phosphatase)
MKKITFIFLLFLPLLALAQHELRSNNVFTVDSFRAIGKGDDTLRILNIFHKYQWQVNAIDNKGRTVQLFSAKPDTIGVSSIDTVKLFTSLAIDPSLIDQVFALNFDVKGSVLVRLNGSVVLATGLFVKDERLPFKSREQSDFVRFSFKDTTANIAVTYLPHPKINLFGLSLVFFQTNRSYEQYYRDLTTNYSILFYSQGFYYLAFGIIFWILFYFFRGKNENLYFSLFCIFIAFSFFLSDFTGLYPEVISTLSAIFGAEFICFFLWKILGNKERSKVPLMLLIVVSVILLSPPVLYRYATFFDKDQQNVSIYIANKILFCYEIIFPVYLLFKGRKGINWEGKVIFGFCFLSTFFFVIIPNLERFFPVLRTFFPGTYINYVSICGLCIIPLGAAIVLGKRNGENQKQLLEKEREKKELLENQNIELERKVNERTSEVLMQKEVIEIKNKAITDNLNYAQRIQSAILPDINRINKAFKQAFVLYLPKDIVSGDFYAFAQKDNRLLIVAGDCTGHGVSGAFMSMTGSSLLNQIINERGIGEPALILNQLNRSVIETFRQSENESNDGMDIAICSFDLAGKTLEYAGANRPLWLIRNREVITVKPDKFPIGGLQMAHDRTFTNAVLHLQENDAVYIFTDGYADQFGGDKGKKMMTAKFKDLLISLQSRTMREQEVFLKEHFENWKGDNEQVDDVLVIGISV